MKRVSSQITATRPARFIQCRPGSRTGLPLIFAESLPKAITDPENVTAADQHADVNLRLVDGALHTLEMRGRRRSM